MSQENVEVVLKGLAAFNRGDMDAVVADTAPDVEYVASGMVPDRRGVFRGREELKRLFAWVPEEFENAQATPTDVIDIGDDKVLVATTFSGRGKQSGAEASWTLWIVWTLSDRKIVRGHAFTSRAEALEAAGLSD